MEHDNKSECVEEEKQEHVASTCELRLINGSTVREFACTSRWALWCWLRVFAIRVILQCLYYYIQSTFFPEKMVEVHMETENMTEYIAGNASLYRA